MPPVMTENNSTMQVNPDGSLTDSSTNRYLTTPWALRKLDNTQRDEQLRRWAMLLQALAAVASIALAVYAFTKRD